MHGRDGEDAVVLVPPGTILYDADTGALIKDFGKNEKDNPGGKGGERWLYLKGGKGGWGNTHFKTSVNQAPRQFQPGQPAQTARLRIELQLIADIGFVGFPNAGKSSLLDHFTNARPKIAPYPFTTKIPNLGMLSMHERDIVLADIPGIIEGAHEGRGLGLRFLKHISRTSALAFLVDLSDENLARGLPVLLGELSAFAPSMAEKRRVLIATKLDLPESAERFDDFRPSTSDERVYGISVFSGEGLDELREAFFALVLEAEAAASSSPATAGAPGTDEDLFGLDTPARGREAAD